MADFSSTTVQGIVSICRENTTAIGESLNQCFDTEHVLVAGDATDWSSDDAPSELTGPGLLVCCRIGDESLVCAIPASLPLPDWYTEPGDSQRARLETLAMEWSMNLLPPDLECEEFTTTVHTNLLAAIAEPGPVDSATMLPITVDDDQSLLWIVWPLPAITESASAEQTNENVPETAVEAPAAAPAHSPALPPRVDPLARIRGINVPVIVKLAERRIEIEELLRLCPGTIVSFDKPCEDLLELMVSNQLYARGEAVKIGEKFGIKISDVGYVPCREPRVLS